MTDGGMDEESAIPREAAWPQEVVELVKAAMVFVDEQIMQGLDDGPDAQFTSWPRFRLGEYRRLAAALTPFKEIAND